MANLTQPSFAAGELSPALYSRTDLAKALIDMPPCLAELDGVNCRFADPICGSGVSEASFIGSDRSHDSFGQFDVGVPLAASFVAMRCAMGVSPLGPHVGEVVGLRSEEQVIDVDAGRHIATVADVHARRDRAVFYFPGHAVGECRSATDSHNATTAVGGPCPKTATLAADRRMESQFLRQREVTRRAAICRSRFSHDRGPFARLVRAGPRAETRTGPLFYTGWN